MIIFVPLLPLKTRGWKRRHSHGGEGRETQAREKHTTAKRATRYFTLRSTLYIAAGNGCSETRSAHTKHIPWYCTTQPLRPGWKQWMGYNDLRPLRPTDSSRGGRAHGMPSVTGYNATLHSVSPLALVLNTLSAVVWLAKWPSLP